jgi:carbamoyltransferase
MHILGINAYHAGSSACIIRDGQLIAAAEEERFNRRKYWAGFPVNAIRYVLAQAGISAYELDHVGISKDPSANLIKKILFTLSKRPSLGLIRDRLQHSGKVEDVRQTLVRTLGLKAEDLRAEFHQIEHHRAHMASAFFVSPFEEAAIFSVDGMGDFVSTMWGKGRGNHLEVIDSINFPHSLGFFYTAISQWLGFPKYGDEGKVMGLAPYGTPKYLDEMRDIVRVQRDSTFELNLDYFVIHTEGITMSWEDGDPVLGNLFSPRLVEVFGEPRLARSEITEKHQDVAASLQALLEEAEFSLVNKLHRETGLKAICMAGGVALNSSFNGKVLPNTKFEDIFIQPAAGDAGTALGVCYYIWHQILNQPRAFVMTHAYTGPEFVDGTIRDLLEREGVAYKFYKENELVENAAKLVAEGNVLGWYQGRMEWGPRALGNRSIIADPRREDMKDILNARIKHREKFRPFAPSILQEDVEEYFDQSYPDPFMIKVYNVLPDKRAVIPAVTHVDGTGRLQTVDQEYSPLYWSLIRAFKERTGVPVVLNTSFNENEPIVCTPDEALDCFQRTRMDALVMGNYVITKS